MNRIGNMMAMFFGITFVVLIFAGHSLAQMTSPQLLISAAPGLPEGTLVNGPFIVAINGVALAEPIPAVVTNTALWSGHNLVGASYVSSCPTCGSIIARCGGGFTPEAPHSITFVDSFQLPAGFSNPSLSMLTTNDDAANVFLNGTFIGRAQTCCGPAPGELVTTLATNNPSFFQVGMNEIRYELENFNAPCPLSMAYVTTIAFDHEMRGSIDIKPGSFPNSINPDSKGKIPVAILTDGNFATTVNPSTVRFGATGTKAVAVHSALEDVDGDGDTDMILQFNTQDTGIACGDTSASLTGETFSGQIVQGADSVNTVGCR